MSTDRAAPHPARRRASGARGVTLVELVMFIVVISVGVAGILSVMSYTTQHSADPMARQQAILIAESYMEEILLKPFLDPSSPAATQVCPVKEASRAAYDNVCDYNALLDDGVRDQQGNLVSGLTAYNISISVTGDAGVALGPTASQIVNTLPNTIRVLRIDLTVTHDDIPDLQIPLTGYRTHYTCYNVGDANCKPL